MMVAVGTAASRQLQQYIKYNTTTQLVRVPEKGCEKEVDVVVCLSGILDTTHGDFCRKRIKLQQYRITSRHQTAQKLEGLPSPGSFTVGTHMRLALGAGASTWVYQLDGRWTEGVMRRGV